MSSLKFTVAMRARLHIIALISALFLLAGCSIFKPCDCPKFGKAAKEASPRK
jgi:hypothetical protein